ncbi:MAG: NADPH:quinone reductase [Planctomyces sp.]|nr:NADPH:quinone reductase [Planctomyces sp.]
MKAAYISQTGPWNQIQYGDLPTPKAGPGEVLVRVEAVAVNPIDTYIRGGIVKFELPFPWVPGCDVCGVVEEIGTNAGRFKKGDRVWGSNQGLFGRQGTFSEYCAIHEQWLYPVAENISSAEAAAGALVGITAHLGLFLHAGLRSGEVVFVNGGTGGVGSSVVQLAKAAGATVITTAGSAEKADQCRALGADHVIQYRNEDIDARFAEITAKTGPIHVWFETLRTPTLDRCVPLMAIRGRIILMAGRDARPEFPVGPFYVKDLRMIGFAMFNASPDEQRAAAEALNAFAASGAWKPQVSRVMPMSQAAEAHRLQEENTLQSSGQLSGKIILMP